MCLQEGTSNYFKGLMLLLCYLIISASFFVHIDPEAIRELLPTFPMRWSNDNVKKSLNSYFELWLFIFPLFFNLRLPAFTCFGILIITLMCVFFCQVIWCETCLFSRDKPTTMEESAQTFWSRTCQIEGREYFMKLIC